MADPKPYQVAVWISHEIRTDDFVPLRSFIEEILILHLAGKSKENLAELSEELEPHVYEQLGVVADQLIRTGTEPSFLIEGEPGSAYIKAQNLSALKLLSYLRAVEPLEFERLCAAILAAIGGKARHVGKTNDGGVDFVATDVPISFTDSPALIPCYPLVIGQAKRYQQNNLVTVTDLRGFLGGALLQSDEIKRKEERYGLFSPVVFAFWTTSNFNVPARRFASEVGLWCLDGIALAQLAIRLKLPIPQE